MMMIYIGITNGGVHVVELLTKTRQGEERHASIPARQILSRNSVNLVMTPINAYRKNEGAMSLNV